MAPTTAKAAKKSVFETLNDVNVSDKTETKNGLTYLSWAWAWGELKKRYPETEYTVYENEHGWPYFTDGHSCWVKVGVTVVDDDKRIEHIEYLPIMNMRNQSIPAENVTSMDVNKAIQRGLTKAAARHGLGLYIYAGEDLPETSKAEAMEKENAAKIIRAQIGDEINRCIRKGKENQMSIDEQRDFARTNIYPVIGNGSYTSCTDLDKLNTLLDNLKKVA